MAKRARPAEDATGDLFAASSPAPASRSASSDAAPDRAPEPAPAAEPVTEPVTEPGARAEPPLFSVRQLTAAVHGRLADLGRVRVEGEVSRPKRMNSGHVFFDLKDEAAKLACKIWQSKARQILRLDLEEGLQIVAWGRLDVYAPQGSYSLVVDRLEPLGIGALLAQLEARKVELRARGWFDRHRPLPAMPRVIGLVTSRDGAALRDFLRTRSLRWPGYPVRLCHTPVQGPGAAPQVARAIERLAASGVDVIVVARGGGSIEDLWTFNEEVVAEAIWNSPVPVVTGVGHETDTTLADLVADHRAHTPTDAAQSVLPDRAALYERAARLGNYLVEAATGHLEARLERLARVASRPVLRDADWILAQRGTALQQARARLAGALESHLERRSGALARSLARLERHAPRHALARQQGRLDAARLRLEGVVTRRLERSESAVAALARGLEAVSPLAVLARGYSLTRRPDGTPVVAASDVAIGAEIETRLARGGLTSRVVARHEEPPPTGSEDPRA